MSLFGNIDATEVPDNPFYVAPDTYLCVLTEAEIVEYDNGNKHGFSLKWVIEDEDSEYHGNSISDWFNIYPDVEPEDLTQNQKRSLSNLKGRLLSLGVSEEEMNEIHEDLDRLVGISAYVTVKESRDKNDPDKVYSNVRKVELVGADD